MRIQCILSLWLQVVVILFAQTYLTMARACSNSSLNVTVEGSKLMWWIHSNNTSNQLIQYSVAVYTSSAAESDLLKFTERTTATTSDLDLSTLALPEGTYYVEVEAFVAEEHIHVCAVAGDIAVNATTQGKASQRISLTMLLVFSSVLGTAVVLGSFLFAMTMWRMRAQGRLHDRAAGPKAVTRMSDSTTTCTLCPCMRRRRTARRNINRAHNIIVSNGLQLRTIEGMHRDMNVFSLVSRDSTVRQSDADSSDSQPPSIPERVGDPPYGYISPTAINIPPFRASKRSTVSEGRARELMRQKASIDPPEEYMYMYTASEGGVRRPVCRERCAVSFSDSIYSIPCSDTVSMEDEYDNTPSYLTILPS